MSKARIRSITKKKYRPYPSNEKVIQLKRIHSSLGYQTPQAIENRIRKTA
jgi:hypothetical protein